MKLTQTLLIICIILLATFILAGYIASSSQTSTFTPVPRLTLELLKNAEYQLADRQIRLTDGIYQYGEGFVTPTIKLWDSPIVFTDLNADGFEDVVEILEYAGGGSAQVRILAVVLDKNGTPQNVAIAGLGDRTKIKDIRVAGKIITLDVVTHRIEDGLCCPTLDTMWQFRFDDNKLILLR